MLAVRLSHERQPYVAPLLGVLLRDIAPLVALDGRVSSSRDGATGRTLADDVRHLMGGRCGAGRRCARGVALRAMVRAAAAAFFVVAAPPSPAAALAPLRRCRDGWSDFF
ncbi:hypothetical protein F511_45582 [Dorcoceras hygrometricum]|uniref:Uncharacterized protein n=1 Tax=Dorcoceras hygrometricum TaxID=472368 RepID=A0A2Z7A2T2_9LAMI|nr:hypothetical protein F511_45582 [Dorcoceras hygrometricum]